MKKCFLAVFICFNALLIHAQSVLIKGYIVNEKGDTLKGEAKVNPKKEIDNYNKVNFKDETGLQKLYKPNKIKAYGFNDEQYISMDSDGEKKFYKVLATGEINFYKLGYEAMRMNQLVFEVEYYVSNADDKELVVIKESKFKKQLSEWMKDNTEFIEAYGDEKKFNLEKALEVIKNYNSWKAGK
jgi:hypothetical protein